MKGHPILFGAACWLLFVFNVPASAFYVDVNSTNPIPPYASWSTAATNIQDAVDVATNGDLVLVTNGLYQTASTSLDGFTTNRVAVGSSLTLRSVNGPSQTIIDGSGAVRCVSLAAGATLEGFTLQNGLVAGNGGGVSGDTTNTFVINCIITQNNAQYGGGLFQCTASRCIISTNSAYYNGYYGFGGGANGSILNDCLLVGNFGYEYGGAAVNSTLDNCTVTGNNSRIYGNTFDNCIVNNCIVQFNYGVYVYYNGIQLIPVEYTDNSGGTCNYCCITPDPGGTGNITSDPLFVDNNGDFHLQTGSPCINAGNNDLTPTATDLDGVIRIQGGTVDIGAYESPGDIIPILNFAADRTNVIPGYPIQFTWRLFFTNAPLVLLDFGDGSVLTNAVSGATHSWSAPGNYIVQLTALSSDYPSGTSASIAIHVADATNYVSLASANPVPPYNSWATAATNIQDAVDVAVLGATVMVSDGVYDVGGRGLTSLTNRVLVTQAIAVKSVNGPAVTTIVGNQVPGTINDFGAVRCVYLADGATLSGFTLTNGATEPGNDDGVYESYGGGVDCGSTFSTVSNCVFINNSAGDGGGGAAGGTLNNCTFVGNQSGYGGGAYNAWLNNCDLNGNSAGAQGGGAEYCTLNNCTLTGNSAGGGGGAGFSTLNNCIVYYNTAPIDPNYSSCTLNYCCTAPLPDNGTNNITTDPQLADFSHITAGSPCRAAGSTNYSTGVDIDNEAWASPPSIGCDEFNSGVITGPLTVAIQAAYTNVARRFIVNFTGQISGHASSNTWDFGDGTVVNNQPFTSHGWPALGDYPVILRAYNESNPDGVSATQVIHVLEAIHYVAPNNSNPISPYTSWATAATNIQDAVDAAFPGGTVLVTNGIYGNGGRVVYGTLTNRVVIDKPITVQSVNGPAVTVIQGYQDASTINGEDAVRCVYLTNGVTLEGFTLTNGATLIDSFEAWDYTLYTGGGLFCESTNVVVTNCLITGCSASDVGGGAEGGSLFECVLAGNQCYTSAGADHCTMFNCTLTGNLSGYGGGAGLSTLIDCTLANNSATDGGSGTGGGACYCTLIGCTLYNNFSDNGGGAFGNSDNPCILNNCTLTGNSTRGGGGGANGCALTNCTVTGNMAVASGGGVYGGTLEDCILSNNIVSFPSQYWTTSGGGAYGSVLDNCLLVTNSASGGGGAEQCVLNHSTLAGNLALWGGGCDNSQLTNCAVTGNSAQSGAGAFNSTLDHCTTAGNVGQYGGGAEFCVLTGCILATNTTHDYEVYGLGGGADSSTLDNCLIYGNISSTSAGVSASTLNNCTIVSNITTQAGGAVDTCTLYNSVVYYNLTPDGTNCSNSILTNCCTTPDSGSGIGNITNEPVFINIAADDFHLSCNSSCINAGNNAYVSTTNDLDGNPRIKGGTVDIGAYEYQTPSSILSYAWAQQYGLPTDSTADYADSDGDGMSNYAEWKAGTNPTNAASVLALQSPATATNTGITVTWQSVSGVTYYLQGSTNLPAFTSIQSNLVGQADSTSYTDTTATNGGPYFYRVGVQ